MGLVLSVLISYVGVHEAIECLKHIISGILPDIEPNFNDLIEYYTRLLQKTANTSRDWTQESGLGYLSLTEDRDGRINSATIKYLVEKSAKASRDWIRDCDLGYLSITEDKDGNINSATIKYYDRQHNTTAILFSTKISSFGQDSVEDSVQVNGDIGIDTYPTTKTKTIISSAAESFSVGQKKRSPTPTRRRSPNAYERDDHTGNEGDDANRKLTWEYSPIENSPRNNPSSPLPEIQFESYSGDKEDVVLSEDFLRSLDGIKYRPLQRNDPSGRRRSFRKRGSSSSNSSKESRASREEELKMFTSLEEDEFKGSNRDENYSGFGSAPNLAARSYSRSRSREKSGERRNESPFAVASLSEERSDGINPLLNDVPKLSSFEEKDETKEIPEVTEEEEDVDFWANIED